MKWVKFNCRNKKTWPPIGATIVVSEIRFFYPRLALIYLHITKPIDKPWITITNENGTRTSERLETKPPFMWVKLPEWSK